MRLWPRELVILAGGGEQHTVSDELDSPVRGLDRIVADHQLDANVRLHYAVRRPHQVVVRRLPSGRVDAKTAP
jgi:hypothetical protein